MGVKVDRSIETVTGLIDKLTNPESMSPEDVQDFFKLLLEDIKARSRSDDAEVLAESARRLLAKMRSFDPNGDQRVVEVDSHGATVYFFGDEMHAMADWIEQELGIKEGS